MNTLDLNKIAKLTLAMALVAAFATPAMAAESHASSMANSMSDTMSSNASETKASTDASTASSQSSSSQSSTMGDSQGSRISGTASFVPPKANVTYYGNSRTSTKSVKTTSKSQTH
jgi:hypothetical protein